MDPAATAMRQIRDIAALVRPGLISAMRAAASRLDIADSPRAEEAIENALHGVSCDPTVQVSGFSVELPVTADEAAAGGRTFRETHRTTRMTKMKVDRTREMLAGGNPDVLAMHLANHPEDTGPIIEMMVAGDIAEAQNMLNAISIMYGRSGTEDEPFETRDERKMLMDRFLARALPTGGMRVSGMASADERGSRLRGSLLRSAEEPARKAIKGAIIDDEEEADTAGAGDLTRVNAPHLIRDQMNGHAMTDSRHAHHVSCGHGQSGTTRIATRMRKTDASSADYIRRVSRLGSSEWRQ